MADCEFCGSGIDVESEDMGEGRVMLLCASCRANIAAGEERDKETMKRTTQFVMSPVEATPDCPVLFVKIAPDEIMRDTFLSLARIDDIERLKREVRAKALDEVQEFVVAHAFDTSVGRRIDDFITSLLEANKGQTTPYSE